MFARNKQRNRGQAMIEYSVMFAFVVIVLKATMVVITPRLGETYCTFMSEVSGTPTADCGVAEEPVDLRVIKNDPDDNPDNGPWCIPLVLEGQGSLGEVIVVNEGDQVNITYNITEDGWCLDNTQVHVGQGVVPALEDFTYQHEGLDCLTSDSFTVAGNVGEELFVAIAAGVHQSARTENTALTTFNGRVTQNVAHPGGDSYFNTTISGDLTGTFDGFCIDTTRGISTGPTYNSTIWSSYDPNFPDGLIGYKENLDLVNYIINQDYTAHGYTYGDVQRAIWTVIGPKVSTSGLGSWSQSRVDRILEEVNANGEGFVPDCEGGVVAMILQPTKNDGRTAGQVTIIETPMAAIGACVPATEDQTAWAPITDLADAVCVIDPA
jgi:Flp pilus assembly pilin Flp